METGQIVLIDGNIVRRIIAVTKTHVKVYANPYDVADTRLIEYTRKSKRLQVITETQASKILQHKS